MATLNHQTRVAVEAAIYAGHKIEAIKLYREGVPGTDLVDAKRAVEDLQDELKRQHPENFGPKTAKTGCLGMLVGLAGLLALLTTVFLVWK